MTNIVAPRGAARHSCAFVIAVLLLSNACAVVNEGAVDLRRSLGSPGTLAHKNFSPCGNDAVCKREIQIGDGDSVSVHLRTAFIHWFFELLPSPLKGFKRNGEIAIVSNAIETETGKELDFKDLKAGRLVYYSDDVEKGQFLNFNNLPVYGPILYQGGPFALRFVIFEIDGSSEQGKAVFSVLAQLGSIAYPPAAPALGLLNSLGQAFATGDTNDIVFRYEMVLDARGGSSRLNHFTLEAGNYVLIRSHNRQASIPWGELELDEDEGRLYRKATGDGPRRPYTDGTYLVVEVNKNVSSRQIDLAQNSFKELLEVLDREDKARAGRISAAAAPALELALTRRSRIDNLGKVKDLLHGVQARETVADATALANNREDTQTILAAVANSLDVNGQWQEKINNTPAALSERDVKYVLDRLRDVAGRRGRLAGNESMFTRKGIKSAAPEFTVQLNALWN